MKLDYEFFHRDAVDVAKDLVGKIVVCKNSAGEIKKLRITETEAYCGEEDTACHAHKGRTKRTEVLYMKAGTVYVYLCYGMHWLLNIVTGEENQPQAVLIRACEGNANGPGKLTKALGINKCRSMSLTSTLYPLSRAKMTSLRITSLPERSIRGSGSL